MKVAIVHYHLRPGGVTRVIATAAAALAERGIACCAISGSHSEARMPLPCPEEVVPACDYPHDGPLADPVLLAIRLRAAAREALGSDPDCWHVHNHALGKNPALTMAVNQLATEGEALLLQAHDFAEDARPDDYTRLRRDIGPALPHSLYPVGARVHYAVLNGRDRERLIAAGLPSERLHNLPNAVVLPPVSAPPHLGEGQWFVYPTRAIVRKNIGEFLLAAMAATDDEHFAVTLAPDNPQQHDAYRSWVALADELDLPVVFELAQRHDCRFPDMLAAADDIVTTSIAEGFGLAFLEPALAGRPLCGRDIPAITGDFVAAGIDLGHLYRSVPVPRGWIDEARLRRHIAVALRRQAEAYDRPLAREATDRALAGMGGATPDFGRLDADLQERVMRRARREGAALLRLHSDPDPDRCHRNALVTRQVYGPSSYGERLQGLYRTILAGAESDIGHIDPAAVVDAYQRPEDLALLRS